MVSKRARTGKQFPVGVYVVALFLVAGVGLFFFKTQLFQRQAAGGLSGLVSVRGSVSLEQLRLTTQEVGIINKVVSEHRNTFTRVDLTVNAVGSVDEINESTVLEFAVSLQTNEDLVVKSWNRKIQRGKMIAQLVAYMQKAAGEYEEFKRYPDVKQNFKTLYI
ncbi:MULTISPECIES: hypothetical protein [unclassified Pseudodesulfovibrio]|uniref:hypothetical protein n=1 Tax=unclassified Pseudodesulfovibrio TaxID=2661612 RepID=UPI000FEC0CDA|nr:MULTISPECIES: hypothetical protein [unclassified Pseudodesulfovibrio]MCJ2164436.1 hypothetical protein [Pseudodesulfovibrio sp. S3-i]RWU04639.1 hypothetical protein DWB63_07755 [Pseudodesulfovibrio sp. S3]